MWDDVLLRISVSCAIGGTLLTDSVEYVCRVQLDDEMLPSFALSATFVSKPFATPGLEKALVRLLSTMASDPPIGENP